MLGQIEAYGVGQQIFFGKQLSGIFDAKHFSTARNSTMMQLQFSDGSTVMAKRVMLNIPKDAVESLDPSSIIFNDGAISPRTQTYLKSVTVGEWNKVCLSYHELYRVLPALQCLPLSLIAPAEHASLQ